MRWGGNDLCGVEGGWLETEEGKYIASQAGRMALFVDIVLINIGIRSMIRSAGVGRE